MCQGNLAIGLLSQNLHLFAFEIDQNKPTESTDSD